MSNLPIPAVNTLPIKIIPLAEFLEEAKIVSGNIESDFFLRQAAILADGKNLSIQNSKSHWCRVNTFEIWLDGDGDPKSHVMFEDLEELIKKHGGIVDYCKAGIK